MACVHAPARPGSDGADSPIAAGEVLVAGFGDAGACTGTVATPTAPAEKVCVYPSSTTNVRTGTPTYSAAALNTPYGFAISWTVDVDGESGFTGTWAYRSAD